MGSIPELSCIKSTEYSIHTRRCFITGEYCSQQTNIQKERQNRHARGDINAFVVMNLSSVSDVVYAARIKPFIEGLSKYLYLDPKSTQIACASNGQLVTQDASREAMAADALENPKTFCDTLKNYVKENDCAAIIEQIMALSKTADDSREKMLELIENIPWKDGEPEYHKHRFWTKVRNIHVHRADSNPVSNYIICSRICQQMQMADLIIVDVSAESANVFYEFGLATAFRKLILPICFSGSFFAGKLPAKLEKTILAQQEKLARKIRPKAGKEKKDSMLDIAKQAEPDSYLKLLERHIDCFPWRRTLFEHFGLRFQSGPEGRGLMSEMDVHYLDPAIALSEKFGFSDFEYARFPYDTRLREDSNDPEENEKIGIRVYNWLRNSYNRPQNAQKTRVQVHKQKEKAGNGKQNVSKDEMPHGLSYEDRMFANRGIHPACNNTLVVYTMDSILNEEEAGLCIINFYNNITKPMLEEHCFCGDRVAILGQSNRIWDDPKDGKVNNVLRYSVSDLIRTGMNQATYSAERRRIKTSDYLEASAVELENAQKKDIKTYIRNRCIPLNPETPIYVSQLREGVQQCIPEEVVGKIGRKAKNAIAARKSGKTDGDQGFYFFCLYHVMLDTMRYVNEVVVDLSSNSVQAMFWLGAAHGSDIYAVTVRQEVSEKEKNWSGSEAVRDDRPIFDIGGLWTAVLRYDEIDSFYKQLGLIQQGIDQHARLKLPETELAGHENQVFRQLYHASPFRRACDRGDNRIEKIQEELFRKNRTESLALESYYRDRFWRQMLRDNQLHLFLNLFERPLDDGPKRLVSNWDMDTVAELSHYLSKRKVIGRYQFDTLEENTSYAKDAKKENFVSIGSVPKPLYWEDKREEALSLAEYINKKELCDGKKVRRMYTWPPKTDLPQEQKEDTCKREYRYFWCKSDGLCGTQYMNHNCVKCWDQGSEDPKQIGQCRTVAQQIHQCSCDECRWDEQEMCRKALTMFEEKAQNTSHAAEPAAAEKANAALQNAYVLPAQLILWREEQRNDTAAEAADVIEYKYHVSLIGVSGPATKALTALLVDDEQKGHIWGKEENALSDDISANLKRYLPLNILQTHIRKTLYEAFNKELEESAPENADLGRYAVGFLSTVLPQYFLPFLSRADEKRIYNAMEAFLQTRKAENEAKKRILKKLEDLLYEFRGVEALYKVHVSAPAGSADKDDRSILDLELLRKDGDNKPVFSCLWMKTR